ncbi:DMAC1 protein, partial [Atlantisia rogersi]|nr:DMAC1 protein [Atlantisia rogersi]
AMRPEEAPSPGSPGPGPVPGAPGPLFGGCWSCRLLCGAGLLLAGLWIYRGPRRSLQRGVPPGAADIAQITLALGASR